MNQKFLYLGIFFLWMYFSFCSTSLAATYTVQSGDNLSTIAQNYGITLQALLSANPSITNPSLIYPGQVLQIPSSQAVPSPAPASTQYTVKSGDNLSTVAQNYGITLQALLAANPSITNASLIYPGQILQIPSGQSSAPSGNTTPTPSSPSTPSSSGSTIQYTVKPGDNLSTIAQSYGISLQALLAANPSIANPSLIYPGQVIQIPSSGNLTSPGAGQPTPASRPVSSSRSKTVSAVDISNYSGWITSKDTNAWKQSGIHYAIVGTQVRSITQYQIQTLTQAGFQVDAYVYIYFQYNITAQIQEALDTIKGYPVRRLWIDLEDSPGNLNFSQLVQKIQEAIRACGSTPCGIYTGAWWWRANMQNSTQFSNLPLWYANYDNNPSLSTWSYQKFGGWKSPWGKQYKGTTNVGNSGTSVDLNTMQTP